MTKSPWSRFTPLWFTLLCLTLCSALWPMSREPCKVFTPEIQRDPEQVAKKENVDWPEGWFHGWRHPRKSFYFNVYLHGCIAWHSCQEPEITGQMSTAQQPLLKSPHNGAIVHCRMISKFSSSIGHDGWTSQPLQLIQLIIPVVSGEAPVAIGSTDGDYWVGWDCWKQPWSSFKKTWDPAVKNLCHLCLSSTHWCRWHFGHATCCSPQAFAWGFWHPKARVCSIICHTKQSARVSGMPCAGMRWHRLKTIAPHSRGDTYPNHKWPDLGTLA